MLELRLLRELPVESQAVLLAHPLHVQRAPCVVRLGFDLKTNIAVIARVSHRDPVLRRDSSSALTISLRKSSSTGKGSLSCPMIERDSFRVKSTTPRQTIVCSVRRIVPFRGNMVERRRCGSFVNSRMYRLCYSSARIFPFVRNAPESTVECYVVSRGKHSLFTLLPSHRLTDRFRALS